VRAGSSDVKAIEEVWKKNSYQRKQFQLERGDNWMDLGCNVGGFTSFALAKGATNVLAYEAEATCARLAQNNIHLNGGPVCVNYGAVVHDEYPTETIDFYVNSRPMAKRRHSIYQPKKDFHMVTVPAVRFGDLPFDQFDCVKMNIEGAEIELLEKARSFKGIRKLVFEYSFDKDPSIARFVAILDKLRTHFSYVDHNKKIPNAEKWIHYPPNIFVYCIK
jgi:FkbM family methyltransferase